MATAIAPPPAITSAPRVKWVPLLLAIAIGLALFFMPAQHGLTRAGQTALAITAFTIVLWAFGVMNNGVASVLMMALLIPAGAKPALALSGFSSGSWWILLAVLYYGFAMQKTGLAARVSYYILSLFPGSYSGILAAFFLVGAVLSFGIPSMTVRTAIMVPIAWALVQALGLKPRSKGSALIMLTTIEMAVVPGLGLLYGSLDGPVVASVFDLKHIPLDYGAYARILELPILLLCALIVFGNQWVLKPETALNASREFVRGKLRELGSFKRDEAITGVIVACSIVFWATDRWHHLPSFFIGMVGLSVFALSGIVGNADIAGGISWTLLLFMGGIFSLQNVLTEYRLTDWLAGYFVPVMQHLTFSVVVALLAIGIMTLALRFLDPSGFIAIVVTFVPLVDTTSAAGIPPLVLTAALLIPSVPFWATYQNIWIAMGDGITEGLAFSGAERVRLATTYAVFALLTVVISVAYWKLIGAL
jgi:divalent anion:Na+ symporter, DASS family